MELFFMFLHVAGVRKIVFSLLDYNDFSNSS